jgi:hypothetical protein
MALCYHKYGFEWMLRGTSLQSRDGTGEQLKGYQRKASLQNPYEEQVMTPRHLHKWAVLRFPVSLNTVLLKTTAKK